MAEEPSRFTHVGVLTETQKKISILARVQGPNTHMYDLVELWANNEWQIARKAGLVTDAMLKPFQAHVVGKEKIVEFDTTDAKKIVKAIKKQGGKKLLKSAKVKA